MIRIKKLNPLSKEEFSLFTDYSYTSNGKYKVVRKEILNEIIFSLKFIDLKNPYIKEWKNSDSVNETLNKIISTGDSIGAYKGNELVGLLIAQKREWNNTIWIEWIQVIDKYKAKGIGSNLLNTLCLNASENKIREIELETQNTNIPAIRFYRKNGFEFTGLNMSLYNPVEVKDEIAVFMSKKIACIFSNPKRKI